jgi:hypothetical protein
MSVQLRLSSEIGRQITNSGIISIKILNFNRLWIFDEQ